MRKKLLDFSDSHEPGVSLVKGDESFDPVNVGLFGADGIMLDSDDIPCLLQQTFFHLTSL